MYRNRKIVAKFMGKKLDRITKEDWLNYVQVSHQDLPDAYNKFWANLHLFIIGPGYEGLKEIAEDNDFDPDLFLYLITEYCHDDVYYGNDGKALPELLPKYIKRYFAGVTSGNLEKKLKVIFEKGDIKHSTVLQLVKDGLDDNDFNTLFQIYVQTKDDKESLIAKRPLVRELFKKVLSNCKISGTSDETQTFVMDFEHFEHLRERSMLSFSVKKRSPRITGNLRHAISYIYNWYKKHHTISQGTFIELLKILTDANLIPSSYYHYKDEHNKTQVDRKYFKLTTTTKAGYKKFEKLVNYLIEKDVFYTIITGRVSNKYMT